MDVVFDTGSDWLVIEGYDCSNCEGNVFLGTLTGTPVNGGTQSTRSYGSASLRGTEYLD